MAKNDKLLLDGIIDDRISIHLPSNKRDEAFEYLTFEQLLKDSDLSTDEILYGSIDGRQDGGIDGFFVLVNGHLLQDLESFTWPRTNSELKLILITCKHHDTFKQATLDSLIATLTEILDFTIEDKDLTGAYSELLLRMRNNLKFAYRKLSPRLSSFKANIYYASRGEISSLGEEVMSRGKQITTLVEENFGSCRAEFEFVGATELVELHRKIPNYTLELPFVEALTKGERYVVLARLSDYFDFISDNGKLRRYLFESNVRDFMGLNRVNEDIKTTLESDDSPDFWWLNNGVTILTTSATIIGKSIQANDIQIVNGLQTTESVFRHFSNQAQPNDDRCILIKVIVTKDESVRDSIIRATNNQTDVELVSLHATDKIQRDIEDILFRHGLYYERRKNYYANQGHTPAELVTPLYAAAGYIALVLKIPQRASTLRARFMRSPASYEKVFAKNTPLEVWPKVVHVLKRVDSSLETLRPRGRATDKFLKSWRYITAFLIVSKHFKKFTYTANELSSIDVSLITHQSVEEIWTFLQGSSADSPPVGGWRQPGNVFKACEAFAKTHGISGIKSLYVNRAFPPGSPLYQRTPRKPITDEFISKVKDALPPQPWKPGIHHSISAQLNCNTADFFAAVDRLIEDGSLLKQRDGVLYDTEGNVVSFDPDRVDPETLELNKTSGLNSPN